MVTTLSKIINHGFEVEVRKYEFINHEEYVLTNAPMRWDFDARLNPSGYQQVSQDEAAKIKKMLIVSRGFSAW